MTESSNDKPESRADPLPHVTLPKGGGAIHGIGEKFSVNAVTGTSGLSLPLSLSSGRSGLTPQLQLSYDSGNGPFGFGWKLSLAAITRKTDEGLPQYRDGDGSDVFILAGAEDLVPILGSAGAARSARERSATQADSKYEPPSGAANCERSLQHLSRHRSFIPFVRRFVANRFAARWHAPERCRLPDLGGCADQGWSEAISTPAIEDRLRMRKSWRREAESNRRYRFCRPMPYHLATAPHFALPKTLAAGSRLDAIPLACLHSQLHAGHAAATTGAAVRFTIGAPTRLPHSVHEPS